MTMAPLDWRIVVLSLAICLLPALRFGRQAGTSTAEFFVSGRSVPRELAGFSMVATTFCAGAWLVGVVRWAMQASAM